MKVTFRTLQSKLFHLELEETTQIKDVKSKINETQGDAFPVPNMVLVHQGKLLANEESTLADNKISEQGFVVVMIKNAKRAAEPAPAPAPAAAPEPAAPAAPAAEPAPAAPADATETEAAPPATAGASAGGGDAYGSAASTLVSGSAMEGTITQLMDMGFDRGKVEKALRAAFNNPDRAVEYLFNGIPEGEESQPRQPAPAAGAPTQAAAPQSTGPNSAPLNLFPPGGVPQAQDQADTGALDFLRNNQQFRALRTMVRQNPDILQPMLQELGRHNPQLLQQINANQTEFVRLINEPFEGEEDLLGSMGAGEGEGVLQVTQEESEAIERLQSMGFDRNRVIEAFFACDKNENLAANYLLNNAGDDMGQ
mmetsp:Transcript_780/g.2915  ORF Transcript_780/g.2915 Transcript_780/m.2915 type:complete len:367 (-) Transcript_780:163-1263(-)